MAKLLIDKVTAQLSFRLQKTNQRWRPAQRGQGQALPEAVVQNLMARDISEQDYDLLLQLDKYVCFERFRVNFTA